MRFAYIDSHGNEVPIPSVDALALRIELGAVGPETQLYDAQADQWGPAKTHEIFHTLVRDADDEGFIAPPPPVAPPPPAAESPPAETASPPKPRKPERKEKPEKKEEPEGKKQEAAFGEGGDLGLTLADPAPAPPDRPEKQEKQEEEVAAAGFVDLDLDLAPSAPAPRAPTAEPESPGGGFDFGAGGLELEEPLGSEDLPLESPMDLTTGSEAAGDDDDLMLETPMSEFQPDSPPGWMEAPIEEEVMDFSTVSDETPAEEEALVPAREAPARERREPKARPSAPKFKRQRALSGPIVLGVLLLALGVGGYVGWPILSARLSQPEVPERPTVVMPAISAELLPRMHALADQAIADAVRQVDAATTAAGAPLEPPQQWLAGAYLGNASQFPGIEAFWLGMGQFVDGLRSGDWEIYHEALEARVAAAGLSAEQEAIVVERADSGLVAAQDARQDAYDALERLVLASLDLHDFLIDNEAGIEYRPASTSTADPVLEAVPTSAAIGDRMWDMVDEITESLDALGSLDRVTRERLVSAMEARLQDVGVQ
ncbi:MAG TPA: hypothetical protein VMM35_05125 [Longimicrobiales bacterium]|nr:hypothetical protein [Longimicrobiales bacterium]